MALISAMHFYINEVHREEFILPIYIESLPDSIYACRYVCLPADIPLLSNYVIFTLVNDEPYLK